MSGEDLFLSLDLGTSGAKAGVFDAEGRLVVRAAASYDTLACPTGWVEQDPASWWRACLKALTEAADRTDRRKIQALCVTGLGPALVCVDDRGEAVRPAPIWSDQRSVAEQAELTRRLGCDTTFSLLPRILWLKRNEKLNYQKTQWVFQSFDYISFKLTGQVACIAPSREFPPWTPSDIEKSDLDAEKFPSRLCQLGEIYGSLKAEVAAEVGLPHGLPIVSGTVDTFASWIGTATIRKGVACNNVGTSEGISLVWDEPLRDPRGRVHSIAHITGHDWIVGGAMSSGGILLDWFIRRFYDHRANPFEQVEKDITTIPAGSDGIVALPYLVGERSPILDPHARCVFFGIGERHTRAHFARAVLESVAFAVRDVCEVMKELGAEIDEVRIAGGAAHLDAWSQIKADVLGKRVMVPLIPDAGLLGGAIIAGWGVGRFADLAAAAEKMAKFRAPLEPNMEHYARYSDLFKLYRGLYAHLKDDFAKLAELNRRREN